MNVLALDPARHCGFAHSCGLSGVHDLGSKHPHAELYFFLTQFGQPYDLLAAEHSGLGSHHISTQGVHGEYRGVLKLVAQQKGIPLVLVNPASMKCYATNSGRAKKPDMVKAAFTQFGKSFRSHDECDAFWVLKYVEAGMHERTPKAIEKRVKAARKKEPKLF